MKSCSVIVASLGPNLGPNFIPRVCMLWYQIKSIYIFFICSCITFAVHEAWGCSRFDGVPWFGFWVYSFVPCSLDPCDS